MAQLGKMIPFLIYWETGVKDASATNEELFHKARAKGIANDPADCGGATLAGVTIGTYRDYCRRKGRGVPSVSDLRKLTYTEWLDILQTMFWDRWKADLICDQRVAEMLVDWVWTSGAYGITVPQKSLGVNPDGIVGPKTLGTVNSTDPAFLFNRLKNARIAYIEDICRKRLANSRFRNGWLRRIDAL